MYSEQYSSKEGPATISIVNGDAQWSVNIGGVVYSGTVPADGETDQNVVLHRARVAVDKFILDGPKQTPVEGPVVGELIAPAVTVVEEEKE
jgi:hypothetical protein